MSATSSEALQHSRVVLVAERGRSGARGSLMSEVSRCSEAFSAQWKRGIEFSKMPGPLHTATLKGPWFKANKALVMG